MRRFSRNARLFLGYALLAELGTGIWRVMFSLYLLAAGFNLDYIGLVMAINFLFHGIMAFPAGLIADKLGRRFTFAVASASAVVTRGVLLFTLDPFWVLVLIAGAGISEGFHAVASGPFIMENSEPEERSHLFALESTFINFSAFVGSMGAGFLPVFWGGVFGVIPAHYLAVRWALVISLPLTLISLIPLLRISERRLPEDMIESFAELFALRNIQSHGTILRLASCALVYGLGFGFIIPFYSVFFREAHLLPYQNVGTIMASGYLGSAMVVLFLAPWLARRFGKARGIPIALWVSVPFVFLMGFTPFLPPVVAFFILQRAFWSASMPLRNQLAMELVVTRERGTTNGLIHALFDITGAPAAALAGVLMAGANFSVAFAIAGAIMGVPGLMYYYFFAEAEDRHRRMTPASTYH